MKKKGNFKLIIAISIVIPMAVAFLLFGPQELVRSGDWVKKLPFVNSIINSVTFLILIIAWQAVRMKNVKLHRSLMTAALLLGACFLSFYVLYHASVPSTKFGDVDGDGIVSTNELAEVVTIRVFYFCVLISHIVLSIVVIPLVLTAFYYALNNQIDRHRKIVKFAYPVWLYVSATGVITFYLISPYYQ